MSQTPEQIKHFDQLTREYVQEVFGGVPKCFDCAHYHGDGTCEAFPRQIPYSILCDEFDHTKPYRGDHGIRFKPTPPE